VRPTTPIEAAWRVEILDHTASEESWISNDIRYQWLGEAWEAGKDLLSRWMGPKVFRVMRAGDPAPWAQSDCLSCPEAMKGAMYPTHHISPSCDHQQQPHCTGDGCF
jgi:hypothetical protein